MTYASGGLISATDYNNLVSSGAAIGNQWGVGTGNHGLGQSTSAIAAVATSNNVTATQWTGLISTINNCLAHQGQSTITPSSVTAGNLITYYASIATGTAAAYNGSGTNGLATSVTVNQATTYSSAWTTSKIFTQSLTFSSGDAARYFFNAGGNIQLVFSRTGGSVNGTNTNWTNLATACGVPTLQYNKTTKASGSGTPSILLSTAGTGGYWAGTGSYVIHFKQFDTASGYSNDYIQVEYYWSGIAANGGYPVLNIKSTWYNAVGATVNGNTSTSIVVNSPATTYLSNTWGTPVFAGSVI